MFIHSSSKKRKRKKKWNLFISGAPQWLHLQIRSPGDNTSRQSINFVRPALISLHTKDTISHEYDKTKITYIRLELWTNLTIVTPHGTRFPR